MEILFGRCTLPPSSDSESLLARYEAGLFLELLDIFRSIAGEDRLEQINRKILPRCQPFIEAVGNRMAYDAARSQGIAPQLIALYTASVVRRNGAWYAESAGLGHRAQADMEEAALDAVIPDAEEFITALGAEPYITAPIVSDENWAAFESSLQVFSGRFHPFETRHVSAPTQIMARL